MKSNPCSRINPNWFFVLTLSQFGATGFQSQALTHYSQRVQAKARNPCATAQSILGHFLSTGSSQTDTLICLTFQKHHPAYTVALTSFCFPYTFCEYKPKGRVFSATKTHFTKTSPDL